MLRITHFKNEGGNADVTKRLPVGRDSTRAQIYLRNICDLSGRIRGKEDFSLWAFQARERAVMKFSLQQARIAVCVLTHI
jgi:hypothetical protein